MQLKKPIHLLLIPALLASTPAVATVATVEDLSTFFKPVSGPNNDNGELSDGTLIVRLAEGGYNTSGDLKSGELEFIGGDLRGRPALNEDLQHYFTLTLSGKNVARVNSITFHVEGMDRTMDYSETISPFFSDLELKSASPQLESSHAYTRAQGRDERIAIVRPAANGGKNVAGSFTLTDIPMGEPISLRIRHQSRTDEDVAEMRITKIEIDYDAR